MALQTLNKRARDEFDHGVFWNIPTSEDALVEARNVGYALSKHGGMRGVAHAYDIEKCLIELGERSWRRGMTLERWVENKKLIGDAQSRNEIVQSGGANALFFPASSCPVAEQRLHPFDVATKQMLGAACTRNIRLYVQILKYDREFYSFGTLACAAVAKAPHFTPDLILDEVTRHNRFRVGEYADVDLPDGATPANLRRQLSDSFARARDLFQLLPYQAYGKVLVDQEGLVCEMSLDLLGSSSHSLRSATFTLA